MRIKYNGIEWDNKVIEASAYSSSAAEAAAKLGIKYDTYRKHARRLGVFIKNQAGKGMSKNKPSRSLTDIFAGKYPQTSTVMLKKKLFKAGLKSNICERCGLKEWQGKPITCELHHKNGNTHDHSFHNLEIICPNCHSQTDTFRSKSRRCSTFQIA